MGEQPFEAASLPEPEEEGELTPLRKLRLAMEWLAAQLADGHSHTAGDLLALGVEAGHTERTLQRASTALHVEKTQPRGAGGQRASVLWRKSTS